MPSSSPTAKSGRLTLAGSADCVPPVILSVFSGTRSLGTYLGSTELSMSGGGLSFPRDGMSLLKVELVFVMCGLSGFSFWYLRCSSALGWTRSLNRAVVEEMHRRDWVAAIF